MKLNRILKGSRVAEIDRKAIADGIDSKWLMKNAGSEISKIIISDFEKKNLKKSPRGIIICGGGNNGGDGFVAARDLTDYGFAIHVFYITPPGKFSIDSNFYFTGISGDRDISLSYLDPEDKEVNLQFVNELKKADFVLDAIFGTGLHGKAIHGPAGQIINKINNARQEEGRIIVYAVDIPSGVDSNDGQILGAAVKADKTITFGCKKVGLVTYPGAGLAGDIESIDIGIPEKYYQEYEQIFEPDLKWVAEKIPLKVPWTHKHKVGNLLVIAGSAGYTGAASMACLSALRSGAGLVTLVCLRKLNGIFEEKLTEVMTFPVGKAENISLHADSLEEILEVSNNFDAAVIGPGISTNASTIQLVRELLNKINKPVVLDADGLLALSGLQGTDLVKNPGLSNVIITPHAGELSRMLGVEKISLEDRISINLKTAKKYGVISVLKGAGTIISDKEEQTFINPTGNWGMATAGTGDVLAGIIGSFLCQGMSLLDSAVCGVYVHGLSGDIICSQTSKTSLMATDLLEGLKKVFLIIEKMKY